MRKEIVLSLVNEAKKVAQIFSNPDRAYNKNKETFVVQQIMPHSDFVATVVFQKRPSMKLGLMWFFYVKDRWVNFFPTDSHYSALEKLGQYRETIEKHNIQIEIRGVEDEPVKQTVQGIDSNTGVEELFR